MAYTQQTPIGTPDVNLITKTLAGLQPDSALQQYAMLHKNNPYILSLAKSESDRRKTLRTAAQGQNAGQMPTVVDQNIAGMAPASAGTGVPLQTGYGGRVQTGFGGRVQTELPEDQGIAQIPTPNMRGMADGGIAGYEDDEEGMATGGMGGMFNFAQQSEPVVRMSGGGAVQKFAGKGEQLVRTTDGGKSWFLDVPAASRGNPAVASALANQKFASREEAIAAYDAVAGGGSAPAMPDRFKTPELIIPYGQSKATNVLGNAPPPPPAPAKQQGLGSIPIPKTLTPEQAKEQAGLFGDFSEARTALKQAESDQETQGARMRTTLSEGLPKTPAMQGLEKLLDKQEAETGGEKDKAAGLALLSAGLAIAGGSSQFALQNLKEAIPAVAQYGEALKDIKKMERENMKMRGDIEVARRAEDSNNLKLKLDVEGKIADRRDKLNDMGINLLAKITDTDTRTATSLWTSSQDNAARIQASVAGAQAHTMGQLSFLEKLGSADPNSALRKGYDLTQQEKLMFNARAAYEKMASDTTTTMGGKYATKGEEFRAKYPTPEVYMATMPATGGGQGQLYSDNMVNPNAVRTR
jgi:hypothetical protein